jgi:hypothetical protein
VAVVVTRAQRSRRKGAPDCLRDSKADAIADEVSEAAAAAPPPLPEADEPPPVPTTPEQERAKLKREEIEKDPGVMGRPSVRLFRMVMATESLKDIFGNPLKDKNGQVSTMPMEDQVTYAAVAAAINPQHPKQFEFAQMIFAYLRDKPRESIALTGENGGPIRSIVETENLSPEQMAARFVRAARIAQEVLAAEAAPPKAIDAIEVGAQPAAPAAPLAPGQVPLEAIPAPVLASVPMPAVQHPALVQTGAIPRK